MTKLASILSALLMLATIGLQAADKDKVLRLAFPIAETSFDNAFASDEGSQSIGERIIEPMLEYDYLARPVKLVPRTVAKMPEVTDGGKTITATLQKGIYFADDPAFKGAKRELIAADYAFALKRLMDPKVKSPWFFLVEGKIKGGNEARADAQKTGTFDYDKPMSGLEVVDRYTLRIHLAEPDFNFPYILAMPSTGASAREVVQFYGEQLGSHPVGTGPYRLAEYKRASKIVLEANPSYRKHVWDWTAQAPEDQAIVAAMKGKAVPSISRVEIYTIEEGMSRWLTFLKGEHDYLSYIPEEITSTVKDGPTLKPEFVAKGLKLERKDTANLYYVLFNMEHPVLGGYSKEKIALRRAIQYAYPLDELIRVIFHGDAIPAKMVVPPSVTGHNAKRARTHVYDIEIAKALLDRFGYKDRDGDGFREMPDGSPLVIERITGTTSLARQGDELWQKAMDAVGLKMKFNAMKVPDRRKLAREGRATMMTEAWNADYPDAENFMQLLYGGNARPGGENYARFKLKEFDQRYEKMRLMPASPARDQLIAEMQDLVTGYAPWINSYHSVAYDITQPWVLGYRKHPIAHDAWEYMDIDLAKRPKN
jgi:oligopeptide transport system substrate-binding protein